MAYPSRLLLPLFLVIALLASAGGQALARDPVLLIASPELTDPNFNEAVVLVVFPDDGAPTGVVLNRRIDLAWSEAFSEDEVLRTLRDPIYIGGPVRQDMLWYLVRSARAPEDSLAVLGDLHLSTDASFLDAWLTAKGSIERFFVGYAGWTSPQLEREIESGAWYVLPADLETILDRQPGQLWRRLLARATAIET